MCKIDSLPGTQHELAIGKRNAQLGGCQGGLDMGGHIIGPFQSVGVEGIVFRYQAIEPVFQVDAG